MENLDNVETKPPEVNADALRTDFEKEAKTLIAYINRYRREPIDETFEVEFIPYDWTVNYQ